MTLPSTRPRSRANELHRDQKTTSEQVALVESLCIQRGVQLTKSRRQVLELLWEYGRPMGAYDLIDGLKRLNGRAIGPPTVYRALEFLTSQGFVSKIESDNTFVTCSHPERKQHYLFFICGDCGTSVELEDSGIENRLAEDAEHLGFRVSRRVVEVKGVCVVCITSGER